MFWILTITGLYVWRSSGEFERKLPRYLNYCKIRPLGRGTAGTEEIHHGIKRTIRRGAPDALRSAELHRHTG
jgi:hypothetical protein